jgi:DNA-directed RNA polymerase subunit M/transcription elongation factor TFIIS
VRSENFLNVLIVCPECGGLWGFVDLESIKQIDYRVNAIYECKICENQWKLSENPRRLKL